MVIKIFKKNKLLVGVVLAYIILSITMPSKAVQSGKNSMYYVIEMLEIMPVIFILTSLIETWVPKDVIIKSFGENAGFKGGIFAFLLGSFSAGPIYAAFPVCKMLLKKGASVFNIVIILSAWAVVKVPMLANEAKFLGVKFMGVRWVLTTISIFVMAYLVSLIVKKDNIVLDEEADTKEMNTIHVKQQYCVGCGLCAKLCSNNFVMIDRKVKVENEIIEDDSREDIIKAAEKCPAKAIYFK